jgi:hypothetical protein
MKEAVESSEISKQHAATSQKAGLYFISHPTNISPAYHQKLKVPDLNQAVCPTNKCPRYIRGERQYNTFNGGAVNGLVLYMTRWNA